MPNNPSNPPDGPYTSTCGADFSSWDGSFTYTEGAIAYTRTSPPGTYNAHNSSNGNAIVFDLSDGTETVQFDGSSFAYQPNGEARYSGNCHEKGRAAGQDAWTATQTS
jgi:hypothetical protein